MPKRSAPGRREESHDTGSVHQRLARLLDTPHLARLVPHLAPETLHQLIRYRGLDACGELVASATPGQLPPPFSTSIYGVAHKRGATSSSTRPRFGEWIEFLVDAGGPGSSPNRRRHRRDISSSRASPATSVSSTPPRSRRLCRATMSRSTSAVSPLRCDLACEVGGYLVRANNGARRGTRS